MSTYWNFCFPSIFSEMAFHLTFLVSFDALKYWVLSLLNLASCIYNIGCCKSTFMVVLSNQCQCPPGIIPCTFLNINDLLFTISKFTATPTIVSFPVITNCVYIPVERFWTNLRLGSKNTWYLQATDLESCAKKVIYFVLWLQLYIKRFFNTQK